LGHIPGPKPNPLFGNILDVLKAKAYGTALLKHIPKYGDIVSQENSFVYVRVRGSK
jgi:hypothetical protein